MQTERKTNPKRLALIELSNQAKAIRQNMIDGATTEEEAFYWASRTINFMLLNHMYNTEGATEFNTFKQWKEKGATIKQGEKAFLIWGQPVGKQKAQEEQSPEEQDDYQYFPMCYLFSNKQVITAEEREADKAKREAEKSERKERAERIKNLQPVELD